MSPADRSCHLDKWCGDNHLDIGSLQTAMMTFNSIVKWVERELHHDVEPAPVAVVGTPRYYDSIRKVLLRAFFTGIAVKDPKDVDTYRTLGENQCALVHPSSSVARGYKYDFVFYDKFLDQGRPYFWIATGFDSQWLFEDSVVSEYINKLLDQPPQSSDKWASLNRLRLSRTKFLRNSGGSGVAGDAKASQS